MRYCPKGDLAKKLDVTTGKAVNYEYDSLGRLIHSYQMDNGTIQQHTEHLYDTENRLVRQSWQLGGTLYSEVVSQAATGTKLKDVNRKDVAIEGVNGAVTGGLMLSGLPVSTITAGRAITNAATSVLLSINNKENCGKAVLKAAGSAAGTYAMGSLTKPQGMKKLVINRGGRTVLRTGGYVVKKLWSFTFNKGSLSNKYKRYSTISSNSGKGARAYAW